MIYTVYSRRLSTFMIPALIEIGFTRNEALVYQAALLAGAASVQQLANATGLNRITVHSISEKFESLHIFTRSYQGKRRRLVPVDPKHLEELLRKEQHTLEQKQKTLSTILPSLSELYRQSQRGMTVTTFTGEEGYEQMCEDILQENADMLEYANIDALNATIGPYIATDYLPRKHKQKIRTKFLFIDSPSARSYIENSYMHEGAAPMEVKFMKPDVFSMDTFFVIYADKLAIFTPQTLDGVIIQDAAIADALRPFFNVVWAGAGEARKNF